MALEINEIGIRMRVHDAANEKGGGEEKNKLEVGCDETLDRAQVVEECVQRVLKLLKAQRER